MPKGLVGKLAAYESGGLSFEEVVELFQTLVDSGMVSHLQGHYGRTAEMLLESGHVVESGGPSVVECCCAAEAVAVGVAVGG